MRCCCVCKVCKTVRNPLGDPQVIRGTKVFRSKVVSSTLRPSFPIGPIVAVRVDSAAAPFPPPAASPRSGIPCAFHPNPRIETETIPTKAYSNAEYRAPALALETEGRCSAASMSVPRALQLSRRLVSALLPPTEPEQELTRRSRSDLQPLDLRLPRGPRPCDRAP